jgi:hypothetical protein
MKNTLLHAQTMWEAWPTFVQQVYDGAHPEWLCLHEKAVNDFILWLATPAFAEHKQVRRLFRANDKKGIQWLRAVVGLLVQRRIFEWKYIQLTEQGRDIFQNSGVKDTIVSAIQSGEWILGK